MYVLAACWMLLGVVFAAALAGKLRQPGAVRQLADALVGMVPGILRTAAAAGIILTEIVVVGALLFAVAAPWVARAAAALAATLMSVFVAGIARSLHRGLSTRCRCFGAANSLLGRRHVVRNSIILAVAVVGAAMPAPPDIQALAPVPALLACAAGALTGLMIVQLDAIVELYRGPVGSIP
jgi:hypothetical protein